MILFIENAVMPSETHHEVKIEPEDSSGRETVDKSQNSVKEFQDTLQGSMR